MEKLPEALVLEILNRLNDAADVARCRIAWKAFNTVYPDLRSITLLWPLQGYIESRSKSSNSSISSQLTYPFKTIFLNLVSDLRVLESVRIGSQNLPLGVSNDQAGEIADDLYLTDEAFVEEWLPRVSGELKSLSITTLWVLSYWRRSDVLSLVSEYCQNLVELELKNAGLSLNKLSRMPMLTSLTLEIVRLDDYYLDQLNKCFPNLEVLNLIDVRGLKIPTIRLFNLKTCHWSPPSFDSPSFLSLITPNLITLRLECIRATTIYIEAPMLSHFHLALVHVGAFTIKNFENLKSLWLESSDVQSLLGMFPITETVENLTLDLRDSDRVDAIGNSKLTLSSLFDSFPSLSSLCFKPRVWLELDARRDMFGGDWWDREKGLKTFRWYLLSVEPLLIFSLLGCVLDQCVNLVDVSLLIRRDVGAHVSRCFISRCMARWPRLNWRFGLWEEGKEDSWISI